MKRQCNGCGNGGDWALKVDAQQTSDTAQEEGDQASDGSAQPRRISVLFYVADEQQGEVSLHINKLQGQATSDQAVLVSSGHHPIAGDWQLHVTSSSKHQCVLPWHCHKLQAHAVQDTSRNCR